MTGIKIRRLGQLGDAPKNLSCNLVLPTGVQPAKSGVESAVPLAPGDGRLARAAGIEPNTLPLGQLSNSNCVEGHHMQTNIRRDRVSSGQLTNDGALDWTRTSIGRLEDG